VANPTEKDMNMSEMAVYYLQPIVDDPRYEGFAFVRKESIRGKVFNGCSRIDWDFGPDDLKTQGRAWTVPPLAPFWTPQPVIGRVRAFNDYPCVDLLIPAFSRRAVDALRDFLEPNGELLPLVSDVGEYFAYNVTTVADALDEGKSEIAWLDGDKRTIDRIFDILRYEFLPEQLTGLSIFLLVEMGSKAFVTQEFVDRAQEHQLQGFNFVKLWPLPEGVRHPGLLDFAKKKPPTKKQPTKKKDAVSIKGNTVVLRLPTAKAKPSKAETTLLAKFMDELDALLYDPVAKKDSAYAGSLEGNDVVDGELRLFLTCPDADTLVDKLRPWLRALSWEGGVKVLKRYGEFVDADCREEYVDL
jgi:hypothetical protein